MTWNKVATLLCAAACLGFGPLQLPAAAQDQYPMLAENAAEKLSEHVYVIRGFPNIAIVVGKTATLVVDTGLGTQNGEVVARTAAKLSGASKLFLTTTHFHPEHMAGEGGFPKGTILIRARAQQEELEKDNDATLTRFRQRRDRDAALLAGFKFRSPDILFDTRYDLDLGGVHARLIWAGPAHTHGDEEIFVEEDGVLVAGDVVQNKYGPVFSASGISPRDWVRTIDVLTQLHPNLVIPDHSAPGDEGLIFAERDFLKILDERAHALKDAGTSAIEATKTLNAEMHVRYPDWELHDLSKGIAQAYAQ
jgi:glyoxylase-like metal-dependent hydrolase (beta-lactamase superfamily II)